MRHSTSEKFKKLFDALPKAIQTKARSQFLRLKENPKYPSLHFKKVAGKETHWTVRVDADYRALGYKSKTGIIWYWIGNHSDIDKLIK